MPGAFRAVLFLLVWASCSWFGSWEMNTNNAVRLFAAISIVERGEATIDAFDAETGDKARFGDHVYLDKAPGMTLMALPAVALLDHLSPPGASRVQGYPVAGSLADFMRARTRLAVATGPAILTALAALALFDLALGLTGSAGAALAAALGYALGTPAWGWSTTVLGHAPVAALYVIALRAGWRATGGRGTRRLDALILGASLGWAVTVEYQAVVAGSAIASWAAWRAWRRADRATVLTLAAAGGILALIPLAGYNLFAFGTVFRLGYQGVVGFDGMKQGLFGIGLPDPWVLWNITFSRQRGLFWFAPALLLGLAGLVPLLRNRATRDLGVVVAAIVVITLLLNAGYYYWDGGYATGPRHSIPLVGVLALGIAPMWLAIRRGAARFLPAEIIVVSMAINACVAATNIYAAPTLRSQLREAVIAPFLSGVMRTLPSDYLGWSPGAGFILWETIALPALCWLAWAASRVPDAGAGGRSGRAAGDSAVIDSSLPPSGR